MPADIRDFLSGKASSASQKKNTKAASTNKNTKAASTNKTTSSMPEKKMTLERIDIASLTAEDVFKSHISQRKPLVISGFPQDPTFTAHEKWTDMAYLKQTAGKAPVKVEPMHAVKKQYGTNVDRLSTIFGTFLDSLQQDSDTYNYLTTQYDDSTDNDGDNENENAFLDHLAAQAFPEPVRSLLHDLPMRPEIMGNLALQQMNLWVGRNKEGASSGLHHDFHDNLYILLKGRKRFVLFPPQMAKWSKPYGELEKIHKNGLIVYKARGETANGDEVRSDGLCEGDAARTRVKALDKKMEALREKGGSEEELEALEEVYDEAVENMMDFAIQDAQGDDFDDDDEEEFDDDDEDEDEESEEDPDETEAQRKERKAIIAAEYAALADEDAEFFKDNPDIKARFEKIWQDPAKTALLYGDTKRKAGNDLEAPASKAVKGSDGEKRSVSDAPSEPLSFSQIPTQELHQHLGLREPKKISAALAKAPQPRIIELKAGEMLYLPTSWWHEVTSFSDDTATAKRDGKGEATSSDDSIHMALNYWFHPPDQLDNFKKPYKDDLVWDFLTEELAAFHSRL